MEFLLDAIKVRYSNEAKTNCCLSCGSALEYAEPQAGEILVDLGSGRGNDVIKASKLVGRAGKSIGIDITPDMIQVAMDKAKKLNLKNVEFILSNFEEIPLDSSFVDVVISNCSINHAKEKEKVFKEIYRILKPGGRFVISDVIAEYELPEEIKNDPIAWSQCYGGAIPKEEYFKCISKAGFREILILEESEPYQKERALVRSLTIKSYKEVE